MIISYIKTSGRGMLRNKLFSTINIIGLAVSMSVGLIMIAFISDLFSYDQFHEKKQRIYRVITHNDGMDLASTSVNVGMEIRENLPEVEDITILRRGFGGEASIDETVLPLGGLWADESFLTVFSFPMLQGNPATALKEPYSLVLTEKSANKLFGTTEALGKSVRFDTSTYIVTGVLKDIPKLSHLRFEALGSFSTVELQKPETDGGFMSWGSVYMNFVYIVLPENSDLKSLQANLDRLCQNENKARDSNITFSFQPITKIVVGKRLVNQAGPVINSVALWILGGLAMVVILSACFNYTNLSIARSLRRSREVGIRKVIGALRSHVFGQFVTESVIISLMALCIAFVLFLLLRPQFRSLHSFIDDLVTLELSPELIIPFILLAVVMGVAAGVLPALFFSRINASRVLKDVSSLQLFRHVNIRKALIIRQYVFSLIFITTTTIGYTQYKSFISFDLGFNTANILNINLKGNKANLLKKELSTIPEIEGTSQSLVVMSLGNIYGGQLKYKTKDDSASIWLNYIDENFIPLHSHRLIAGRNFSAKSENAEESEVIINEQLLRRFNIADNDPLEALGEEITIDRKNLTIVGIVKDFHYETVEDNIEPMAFRYFTNKDYGYINVKVTSDNWPATFASLEKAWRKVDKVHALDAKFYDDQIEQAYSAFSMMIKVIGFLAFLAVCISSMGLFGMVVYTTETRLKEISIRKVLGASERKLIFLLCKSFLFLLGISALIALPATYFFFDKVILAQFAYHQPIGVTEMVVGLGGVVAIAFAMLGSQTLRVARSNPAHVLKNE